MYFLRMYDSHTNSIDCIVICSQVYTRRYTECMVRTYLITHLYYLQSAWRELATAGDECELGPKESVCWDQRVLCLNITLILQGDLASERKHQIHYKHAYGTKMAVLRVATYLIGMA